MRNLKLRRLASAAMSVLMCFALAGGILATLSTPAAASYDGEVIEDITVIPFAKPEIEIFQYTLGSVESGGTDTLYADPGDTLLYVVKISNPGHTRTDGSLFVAVPGCIEATSAFYSGGEFKNGAVRFEDVSLSAGETTYKFILAKLPVRMTMYCWDVYAQLTYKDNDVDTGKAVLTSNHLMTEFGMPAMSVSRQTVDGEEMFVLENAETATGGASRIRVVFSVKHGVTDEDIAELAKKYPGMHAVDGKIEIPVGALVPGGRRTVKVSEVAKYADLTDCHVYFEAGGYTFETGAE